MIDDREKFANVERFPYATEVVADRPMMALLALVRRNRRLRRTFRRGLHAGRGLALWAFGRCAAGTGGDRAGPALRLLLSLHLWHDSTASAPLGFVRFTGEVKKPL